MATGADPVDLGREGVRWSARCTHSWTAQRPAPRSSCAISSSTSLRRWTAPRWPSISSSSKYRCPRSRRKASTNSRRGRPGAGDLDPACWVAQWRGADRPLLILHHGSNERPFDLRRSAKNFLTKAVLKPSPPEVNVVVMRAAFHAGSLRTYTEQVRSLPRFAAMLAGADLAEVFLSSRYRRLTSRWALENGDRVRTVLNYGRDFVQATKGSLHPLLARYDQFIEYEQQVGCYRGVEVLVVDKGHSTACLDAATLRQHVLSHLDLPGNGSPATTASAPGHDVTRTSARPGSAGRPRGRPQVFEQYHLRTGDRPRDRL